MDEALQLAVDALVSYVFADGEPTPRELDKRRDALPDTHLNLANLFLNLRLMVRWREFGVSHSGIEVRDTAESDFINFQVRIYDQAGTEAIIRYGLRRAGFTHITYQDAYSGTGGWLFATAPAPLVRRLQG